MNKGFDLISHCLFFGFFLTSFNLDVIRIPGHIFWNGNIPSPISFGPYPGPHH
jgi:hypothetical protein